MASYCRKKAAGFLSCPESHNLMLKNDRLNVFLSLGAMNFIPCSAISNLSRSNDDSQRSIFGERRRRTNLSQTEPPPFVVLRIPSRNHQTPVRQITNNGCNQHSKVLLFFAQLANNATYHAGNYTWLPTRNEIFGMTDLTNIYKPLRGVVFQL